MTGTGEKIKNVGNVVMWVSIIVGIILMFFGIALIDDGGLLAIIGGVVLMLTQYVNGIIFIGFGELIETAAAISSKLGKEEDDEGAAETAVETNVEEEKKLIEYLENL